MSGDYVPIAPNIISTNRKSTDRLDLLLSFCMQGCEQAAEGSCEKKCQFTVSV